MANASTADARVGFGIYVRSGGRLELGEVNAQLKTLGLSPVSPRTLDHYKNLLNAGYGHYIPINRFDVARAAQPYESLTTSSRYSYFDSGTPVTVTFPRGRRLVQASGYAERVAEAGASIVFDDPAEVNALRDSKNRVRISEELRLDFLDPPTSHTARVLDSVDRSGRVEIEVEFERLKSVAEYTGRDALETLGYRVAVVPAVDSGDTVDVVGRQIFLLLEVLEAARSVVNETARQSKSSVYADVLRVDGISRSSPLIVELGMPAVVAATLASATGILFVAKHYESWRRRRLENSGLETEVGLKRARADLEKEKLELQSEIISQAKSALGAQISAEDSMVLEGLAYNQLLGNMQELAAQDVIDLTIEPTDE